MGTLKTIATIFKAGVFATKVVGGVAVSSIKGATTVLETANESLEKINKKDWEGLGETLERRGMQAVEALDRKLGATLEFGEAVEKSIVKKDPDILFSKRNTKLAVAALGTGLAAIGASASLVDGLDGIDADDAGDIGDADDDDVTSFLGSDLIPVEDGMFVGGDEELQNLIRAGELEGTEHIAAEDIDRDIGARDAFLRANGWACVPDGMEVHHIVPLSEGGADDPSNMVLVTEEEHAAITAAHARYYGW